METSPAVISPPFHWEQIWIQNFRVLKHLDLDHPASALDRGQWTLIIGENSAGKTTFLQALAYLLGPFEQLGPAYTLLRSQARAGDSQVSLTSRSSELFHRTNFLRPLVVGAPSDPLDCLWCYGSQRGTAIGGPSRAANPTAEPQILGLFDPDWRMIHAETWLVKLQLAALQEGAESAEILEAVKSVLTTILPEVENIEIRSEAVLLSKKNQDPIPLQNWSDGYLTTAGWILDLIAHWIEYAKANQIRIGPNFCEEMTGLVLIDEIDLHLHPAWQTQIVRDLRRLFPRLSFIATTHNPLTLLGAEPGEIFVLRRNAEGEIEALQRDIPPGSDVDRVLTGDWFGLSSTLDSGTLDLLDRHRLLLRSGSPPEEPERRELEVELRHRLGSYGETAVDRIVQDVAAGLLPPTSKNLAPEERSALRDKILSIASRKLE